MLASWVAVSGVKDASLRLGNISSAVNISRYFVSRTEKYVSRIFSVSTVHLRPSAELHTLSDLAQDSRLQALLQQ